MQIEIKAAYPFKVEPEINKRKETPPWERVAPGRQTRQERHVRYWRRMFRLKVQEYIQEIVEDEIKVFLGRKKSERIQMVDATPGYWNGHGKTKKFSVMNGTITVRRPRVWRTKERFESKIIPFFKRRSKEVGQLLPELYLHGLAKGDFELALRGLLGEGAPLSASSIDRLKGKW